jgi:SAM-dependent methyltransferase
MELFSPLMDIQGLDAEPSVVETCNNRGHKAVVGKAEELPFEDNSFDIVYCSYLLLWVPDPVRVVKEMKRVSRDWIICLAEPDHYGRVSNPPGIWLMDEYFTRGLKKQGADPGVGRTIQASFATAGLRPEVGVHAGLWSLNKVRSDAQEEWHSLASIAAEGASQTALNELKKEWDRAAREGSLVQYTPTFFALARKNL